VKNKIILFITLVLVGCATAKPVMSPNGKAGYSIECDGTAVSMTICYEKAAEACPKGYLIIDTHNQNGVVATQYYVGGTSHKGIFVECK